MVGAAHRSVKQPPLQLLQFNFAVTNCFDPPIEASYSEGVMRCAAVRRSLFPQIPSNRGAGGKKAK